MPPSTDYTHYELYGHPVIILNSDSLIVYMNRLAKTVYRAIRAHSHMILYIKQSSLDAIDQIRKANKTDYIRILKSEIFQSYVQIAVLPIEDSADVSLHFMDAMRYVDLDRHFSAHRFVAGIRTDKHTMLWGMTFDTKTGEDVKQILLDRANLLLKDCRRREKVHEVLSQFMRNIAVGIDVNPTVLNVSQMLNSIKSCLAKTIPAIGYKIAFMPVANDAEVHMSKRGFFTPMVLLLSIALRNTKNGRIIVEVDSSSKNWLAIFISFEPHPKWINPEFDELGISFDKYDYTVCKYHAVQYEYKLGIEYEFSGAAKIVIAMKKAGFMTQLSSTSPYDNSEYYLAELISAALGEFAADDAI